MPKMFTGELNMIPGLKPNKRRTRHIELIEREYDLTVEEVVRGYAEDGHSRYDTADLLGVPRETFSRWLRAWTEAGVVFPWPAKGHSVKFRDAAPLRLTERFYEAARANQKLAAQGNLRRWERDKKATPEAAQKAERMREQGMTYKAIAKELGMDLKTLSRARKNHGKPCDGRKNDS